MCYRDPKPIFLLVITDPFSHMVWLETLYGKTAEELYEKFANRFLLKEGYFCSSFVHWIEYGKAY